MAGMDWDQKYRLVLNSMNMSQIVDNDSGRVIEEFADADTARQRVLDLKKVRNGRMIPPPRERWTDLARAWRYPMEYFENWQRVYEGCKSSGHLRREAGKMVWVAHGKENEPPNDLRRT